MISIRRRDSKELNFLLLIVFGFVLLCGSWTSGEVCVRVSDQILCYFEDLMDWDAAWHLCESRSATLPVIRNRSEQAIFEQFLRAHMPGSKAWTSGKSHRFSELTWFDGREFSGRESALEYHIYERNDSNLKIMHHPNMDENPRDRYRYICQYSGPLCNFFNDTYEFKDGCIRRSDDERSWYDARNQCLLTGGDLAVLDYHDVMERKKYIFLHSCLWMGYRKVSYRWNVAKNASEEDDIKFTNWSEDFDLLTGECVSINASNGKWWAVGCSEKQRVICQGDQCLTSATSKSSKIESLRFESMTSSFTFILVGIIILLASNVIVAVIVRSYMKRKANSTSSCGTQSKVGCQIFKATQRQANSNCHDAELQLIPEDEEFERDCSNIEAT